MKKLYLLISPLIIVFCLGLLTACSNDKLYEIINHESKVTEFDDSLQLEFQYEISNNGDKDFYFTLVFPPYIQENLMTNVGITRLPANSISTGVALVRVNIKADGELTEKNIDAIKSGEHPFIEQVLIGETLNLER